VHGRERKTIIEKVLAPYIHNDVITCDLGDVEKKILEEHSSIEDDFIFLCHNCHLEYDKKKCSDKPDSNQNALNNNDDNFPYLHRIKLWAQRPTQKNHKIIQAYLTLENDGYTFLDNLKNLCLDKNQPKFYVDTFDSNYAQMKTNKGHPHGRVFYDEDGIVKVYPLVREEIRIHFGK
jgi:hypothetical protein